MKDLNQEKLQEVALALLGLTLHDDGMGVRAWKGLDWDLMDSLHERGWIRDPKGKAKSVLLAEEGVRLTETFLEKHFGKEGEGS